MNPVCIPTQERGNEDKEVFPLLFKETEFVTETLPLEQYDVLIIPEIRTWASKLNIFRFRAFVEFSLSFFDQTNQMIFHTSARDSGVGLNYGSGFPRAVEQSLGKLTDNIISSPELLAYADGIKGRIVEHKPEKGVQQVATRKYLPA